MKSLSKRLKLGISAACAALLVSGLLLAQSAWELHRIGRVQDEYRLDDAVHNEVITDPIHKPTVDDILDPPFMQRYGLATKDYLDAKGFYAPNGLHWARWSLETKTAAILMWRRRTDYSATQLRQTIRLVDDYYSRNDRTTPIVKVVEAAKNL